MQFVFISNYTSVSVEIISGSFSQECFPCVHLSLAILTRVVCKLLSIIPSSKCDEILTDFKQLKMLLLTEERKKN